MSILSYNIINVTLQVFEFFMCAKHKIKGDEYVTTNFGEYYLYGTQFTIKILLFLVCKCYNLVVFGTCVVVRN